MKKLTLFILLLFTMTSINAQLNIVEPTFYGKYRITAGAKGVANGGNNGPSSYNITIEKPAGATTIHKVYIYKAYIPDDTYITNGNLTINGSAYTLTNSSGSTNTSNGVIIPNLCYYKEVSDHTTLINKLNTAPIGPVNIAITEPDTLYTDGVGMIIVWNVPTGVTGSYFIMIGTQYLTKDGFSKSINVAPIDISNPALKPILGIGINFSTGRNEGPFFGTQLSEVWVNNNLITSNAGGFDDGNIGSGALITLGGFGDNPDANDADELYNIKNQLTNGVSSLNFTFNDVDNINDDHINVIYFDGAGLAPCNGPDSDGDGIPDMCDLDDDNDGILDTDETAYWENVGMTTNPPATIKHSQGLQITTSKTGTGAVTVYYDPNVGFNGYEPRQLSTVTYNFSKTVYDLKLWMNDMDALEDIRVNYYDENNNRINNLIPYVTQTYQSTAATISNDATYGLRVVATRNANGNSLQNYVQILTPFGVSRVELTFQASGGTTSTPEYYIKSLSYHPDTDGDGIPNHLDLDSDNDGCLDAIEGSENVTTAMLVPAGGTVTVGVGSSASNQNLCASGTCVDTQGVPTVVNTGGAADTGNNQGQDIGYSQSALMNECDSATGGDCTKPGTAGTPLESKVGILTKATKAATWPESVPNGYIVLDSAEKGFVITHMTTTERDALTPVEGMLIYNTTVNCVQLYRGASPTVDPGRTGWNCIERACGIAPRNVNIGYWGSGNYNIFSGHANFKSQLDNTANYSTTGTFKGISGWNWINANTDINATAATFSATQLKAKYDMIVTGWQEMTVASALKIKQYTDLGGVVLVLMDAGEGPNLNVAFGGTSALGTGVNATPGQKARSLNNQISNGVFGIGGNATLYGTSESSRPPITAIPPGAFITSYLNTSGSSISTVNDTGTEFVGVYITGNEGRAIFVYDEGIYRHSSVAGTVIDTPQEIFLHNLMSYALRKVGFSTQ